MKRDGFSLIEALVATTVLTVLMASVFGLVDPAHGAFQAQPETADLQQRLRVASDAIATAIRGAGAGALVGGARGPLVRSLPPVLPYRIGENHPDPAAGVWYRPDVISVVTIPITGAQATLRDDAAAGATLLTLTFPPSCPPTTAASVCGFSAGTRVLLFDGLGNWDALTVTAAHAQTLEVARPGGLSSPFPAGAVLAEGAIRTFFLAPDASGIPQLTQYDGFQSEFPVVDNVVSLSFDYYGEPQPPQRLALAPLDQPMGPWTTYGPRPPEVDVDNEFDTWPAGETCTFQVVDGTHVPRLPALAAGRELVRLDAAVLTDGPWCPQPGIAGAFDADLLRIRRVRVRLRVQVASEALRGSTASLFVRAGRSNSAQRFVPDQQIEFDVAPPNLAMGR